MKISNLDRAIALRTTIHLFLCIGFISAVAFILSAHWLLILAAIPVIAFAWFVLYHFEKGIALWGDRTITDQRATANTRNVPEPPNTARKPVVAAPVTIAWPELLR